ncbi:MAG: GNAT family N-acetyltransferase [Anaerolineae bacterium]|nr:GNAT family N-acetyltransferase [Anaerolineae bacterium]
MSDPADPILRDIPDRIETARLLLRAPRMDDGPAMYAAIEAAREHLRPWMMWAATDEPEAVVIANTRRAAARFVTRERLRFLMFLADGTTLIGSSGLNPDWAAGSFEIGYWVRPEYEGRGYVSETVRALVAFAFTQLDAARVEIMCHAHNVRSAAVAQCCGFTLEARMRYASRDPQGALRDDLVYGLLRAEWEGLHA